MRVLILGVSGMLGHKLWQSYEGRFDTWGTVRSDPARYDGYDLFDRDRLLGGVDAFRFDTMVRALSVVQPDVVVNCIGIIKQLPVAKDPIPSLTLNALFPHRLAGLCQAVGARLIHISTDCVFSGQKGLYTEEDPADAGDLYGRSKLLGEVDGAGCLTLRTSVIGRELASQNGLVEWFLSNRGGTVRGYTHAIYSGFSTLTLAQIIATVIEHQPELSGLYHVSSEPISKYELLCLLRDAYRLPIEVEPYAEVRVDRSLDSSLFRSETGFAPPAWPAMVQAMAADPTPYEDWRKE